MRRIILLLAALLIAAPAFGATLEGVTLSGVSTNPIYYGIGTQGALGFGVAPCEDLPTGFTALTGTTDPTSANYGNYQFTDGSIMVWIPRFYYYITPADGTAIDIKGTEYFGSTVAANNAGYALHRAFIDGGSEQPGFFVDKYKCSKAASGTGYIASSVANGNPISTHADHNPIADLTACAGNAYYFAIDAAHARDGVDGAVNATSRFHVASRFQHAALAMLSLVHGQYSSATTYNAWYNASYNYPKGCNNNSLGDTNDGTVSYTSDGYLNCGKTGSGTPFARTTHNGQSNGVADLNGLMYEVSIGMTCIATTDTIEDVSRANPAVVTETGHDKSSGDYVQITAMVTGDWAGLTDKIYTVTKIDPDTYSLDGVDTSGFSDAYVQGTNAGTTSRGTFYAAKQSVSMADFTSGNSAATDHWGATGVAAMMDSFTPIFETAYPNNGLAQRYGSGTAQLLSESTSGAGYVLTGLGLPKSIAAIDATGTAQWGQDYYYQYIRNELCPLSCAHWGNGSDAGVWALYWAGPRTGSNYHVGFRAACYLD